MLPLVQTRNSKELKSLVFYLTFKTFSLNMSKAEKRRADSDMLSKAKKPSNSNHWASGLVTAMEDPNLRIFDDSRVVVIRDKYPKAQFHFLVLPKEKILNLKEIRSEHLELLEHMQRVGVAVTKRKEYEMKTFKMGFHAEPSMNHLHLHIISDDFCSDWLKTKKHYNSFTTDFFIKSESVIKSVQNSGKVDIPLSAKCEDYLRQPLVCHRCYERMENMPKLKKHLNSHNNPSK